MKDYLYESNKKLNVKVEMTSAEEYVNVIPVHSQAVTSILYEIMRWVYSDLQR